MKTMTQDLAEKVLERKKAVFVLPDGSTVEELGVRTPLEPPGAAPRLVVTAKEVWLAVPPKLSARQWSDELGQAGKDEELDAFTLGRLLQAAGTALRSGVEDTLGSSIAAARRDAEGLATAALTVVGEVKRQLETLGKLDDELYGAWNEVASRIAVHRREFEDRVGSLPPVEVPYGLRNLVEIAERFDRLSPSAWAKVVELASALRVRDDE